MYKLLFVVLSFSLFVVACEDPAANKIRVQASEPSSAAPARANQGISLPISAQNSKIGFTGSKVTGKHDGGFNSFTGSIDLVGESIEDSGVNVEIDMASVFTDADGLTKHLQTGDFFEVEKFPKASFTSTKIATNTAKGPGNYIVTGDLEMRGVKKSVTFPAAISVTPNEVAVNSEFAINRKDFGIVYAGKADDLIRDDVVIKLDLKASRNK